jgi:LysM repeat protein
MVIASIDYLRQLVRQQTQPVLCHRLVNHLRPLTRKLTPFLMGVVLLCGSIAAYGLSTSLLGANPSHARTCHWYTVEAGDTLSGIAQLSHTTISRLVHANMLANSNLIFVDQRLCIPQRLRHPGIAQNGAVNWYDYRDLDWSDPAQVHDLLYQAAISRNLPPRLLLAIAWQESSWTQHVIAWDGGIGVMQLMPYTAVSINTVTGRQLDPYLLSDNLDLGAIYLQSLWQVFHGNLVKVISAYNEGAWEVAHVGIKNWHYVDNVLALMKRLN